MSAHPSWDGFAFEESFRDEVDPASVEEVTLSQLDQGAPWPVRRITRRFVRRALFRCGYTNARGRQAGGCGWKGYSEWVPQEEPMPQPPSRCPSCKRERT